MKRGAVTLMSPASTGRDAAPLPRRCVPASLVRRRVVSVGALVTLLVTALLTGCSSAPKTPETVTDVKDQAAEYADFGNRYFGQGNYEQALRFFELSLRENTSVDNQPGVAQAYNSIGNVYLAGGDVDTAESSFQSAYDIAVTLDEPQLMLQTATHLGEVALRRGENDLAMEFFQQALKSSSARAAPGKDLAILYHDIATVHSRNGEYDTAERYLRQAIEINDAGRNLEDLAANHYMLASVHSRKGEFDAALAEAQSALAIDKQVEHSVGILADLKAIGLIHERSGRLDAADDYLRRALQVAATIGIVPEARSILEALVRVATARGATDDASVFQKQIDDLSASTDGGQ